MATIVNRAEFNSTPQNPWVNSDLCKKKNPDIKSFAYQLYFTESQKGEKSLAGRRRKFSGKWQKHLWSQCHTNSCWMTLQQQLDTVLSRHCLEFIHCGNLQSMTGKDHLECLNGFGKTIAVNQLSLKQKYRSKNPWKYHRRWKGREAEMCVQFHWLLPLGIKRFR